MNITVYVPDDLAKQAKAAKLNISQITQGAIRVALGAKSPLDTWLDSLLEDAPVLLPAGAVMEAIRAIRDENG